MMVHWSSYLYIYPSWIDILAYCTDSFTDVTEGPAVSGAQKRTWATIPSAKEQILVWQKFCRAVPERHEAAKRLLRAHATSAASERNWSLWGRIYKASRSTLGLCRAKKRISICQAEKAKLRASEEFDIPLQVIEENRLSSNTQVGGVATCFVLWGGGQVLTG
jgi:hypothetical protein